MVRRQEKNQHDELELAISWQVRALKDSNVLQAEFLRGIDNIMK